MVLIIGKVPPPIGGVTIHVSRLLATLEKTGHPYTFASLDAQSLGSIFRQIGKHQVVHLHTSNPALRFAVSLYGRMSSTSLISTFHGDIGRFGAVKNALDRASIRLARVPVVLNESSKKVAGELNPQTRLVSSYIPANLDTEPPLGAEWGERLDDLRRRYPVLASTNAFNVSFTNEGREVYRISEIVTALNGHREIGFICSDPSGRYRPYLEQKGVAVGENILLIDERHSFIRVIERSDILLRLTHTDGDSLSVKEALDMGVPVLASDVVSRPDGTCLFDGDFSSLPAQIDRCIRRDGPIPHPEDGAKILLELYRELDASKS